MRSSTGHLFHHVTWCGASIKGLKSILNELCGRPIISSIIIPHSFIFFVKLLCFSSPHLVLARRVVPTKRSVWIGVCLDGTGRPVYTAATSAPATLPLSPLTCFADCLSLRIVLVLVIMESIIALGPLTYLPCSGLALVFFSLSNQSAFLTLQPNQPFY